MQDVELLIEDVVSNLDRFIKLVDAHLERLSQKKTAKNG